MSKAHKDYFPILYARIMVHLQKSRHPQTVTDVANAVLGQDHDSAGRSRVLRVLNNLAQAGEISRDVEPTPKSHVNRYVFTPIA